MMTVDWFILVFSPRTTEAKTWRVKVGVYKVGCYVTGKVKEQITLSDNNLAWFSGADLPHSQDPTYIPNTVSFSLDFIINKL